VAAFAVEMDKEIRLAADRAERIENHDPLDDNRPRVIDESRVENAAQLVGAPLQRNAVFDQLEV
jgi:hypothetical protein